MTNDKIWDTIHFTFKLDFQRQIIVAIIQNPGIYDRMGSYIDYNYFDNIELAKIFKNISEYYDKYKGLPDYINLIEYISRKGDVHEELQETIEDIYNSRKLSKDTVDFTEQSLSEFIQSQELKKAIVNSLDDLGDCEKHENIRERIEEALTVASKMEDLGEELYSSENIVKRIKTRQNNETDVVRYPFRWPTLDLIFGGLGVGEVFTFMGPSHSGKSMFLINLGVNLIIQKFNVLHISLEMSKEVMQQRYDMCLLGLTKQDLRTPLLVKNLKERLKEKIGKVWIKQFPSDVTSPADIRNYMNRLASARKFVPDVLIIDYADIMSSPSKYHEKRHELGAIYRGIRNIGFDYKIAVATATQFNRGSLAKLEQGKILDEQDIAEAYDIMRAIDAGVSINSTVEDRHNNKAILYALKNRDGDIGQKIRFYIDWSKAFANEWQTYD